jgi:hypothetical protein
MEHPFIKNDPKTFNLIDLEKIEVTDCNKLENNTKDCGNFLWILFQSSFKDSRLDKIDTTTFKIEEREIFKKLDELKERKRHTENSIKNESNFSKQEKNDSNIVSPVSNEEDLWEIISSSSIEENFIQFDKINELKFIENYFV